MSPNNPLNGRALSLTGSSSTSQVFIVGELNTLYEQQNVKSKCQIIPKMIRNSSVVRA